MRKRDSASAGHEDIKEDDVKGVGLNSINDFHAIMDGFHLIPELPETIRKSCAIIHVIVCYQNSKHLSRLERIDFCV